MLAWFDHLRRDIQSGGRHLTNSLAFTAVAVLSLTATLGISAARGYLCEPSDVHDRLAAWIVGQTIVADGGAGLLA